MRFFLALSLTCLPLLHAGRTFETDKPVEQAFDRGEFSFDVDKNWAICMARNETIAFDDTVEDYAQKLNETLKRLSKEGGGSVILGEGVFPITVPVWQPKETCIIGQGKDSTTLRVRDRSYPPYAFKGAIVARKAGRVSLVGLTVDGNARNQYAGHESRAPGRAGVYQERVRESYLLNVRSVNHVRHGFALRGADGRPALHVAMAGCEASGNGADGVRLDHARHVAIATTRLARNGRHALAASATARRFRIRDVQFFASGQKARHGCGVHLDGLRHRGEGKALRDIHIVDSAFRDSAFAGLCLRYVSEVRIANSSILNLDSAASACYYVRNVKALAIQNTRCLTRSGVAFVPAKIKVVRKAKAVPSGNSRGCPNGIAYFDVCCPLACGRCGKPGCARRGGKKGKRDACCYSETKRFEEDCATKGKAPCVLRNVRAQMSV